MWSMSKLMQHLQTVQNSTALLVTGIRKLGHVTLVLKTVYWLPVIYRSKYQILVCVYKALHENAPHYLGELVYYPTSPANHTTDMVSHTVTDALEKLHQLYGTF